MMRTRLPALAALAALSLAACGSDDTSTAGSEPSEMADTTEAPMDTSADTTADTTSDTTADTAADTTSDTTADTVATDDTTMDTAATADTAVPATDAPTTTVAVAPAGEEVQPLGAQPNGTNVLTSTRSFDETVSAAVAAIEGDAALTLVATVDHAANAAAAGLELPPTTELIFGNPELGTQLMLEANAAGLDLPQKMLFVEDESGGVRVYWNDPSYLSSRYGLGPATVEVQGTIGGALTVLAQTAAGSEEAPEYAFPTIGVGEGIVEVSASGTAREAADRLLAAIESNDALTLVTEVDHSANAASVGLELPPTIEVIFGNPELGTPLMRESRTAGLDLPQKMLFVEGDDGVTISYNDPAEIAQRHGIDTDAEPVPTITGALEMLASAAAG